MSTVLESQRQQQKNGENPLGPMRLDLRPRRDLLSRRLSSDIRRKLLRGLVLLTCDIAAVISGMAAATWLAGEFGLAEVDRWLQHLPVLLVLVLMGQLAARTYGPVRRARHHERVGTGLIYSFAALAIVATADGSVQLGLARSAFLAVFLGAVLIGTRWSLARLAIRLYRRGVGVKNTLVVASGDQAWQLVERYREAGEDDTRIVGHLSPDCEDDPTALGSLEDLPQLLEELDIRSVIVSAQLDGPEFQELVGECFLHGAAVSVIPATLTEIPARISGRDVLGWPLLELNVPRLHLIQLLSKRTLDIAGSLLGILLLSPVYVALAIIIRLEGKPVLFRQQRLGLGGRRFTIYKFRSMRPDAEEWLRKDPALYRTYVENNYKLPADTDPRISAMGRVLRRTSLDELPQLFNVLVGDMSLVGPRPIVPNELREYGAEALTFLAVKPGITGHWQINGRSEIGYPERADLDLRYINEWSLLLDIKILLLTMPRLLNGAH